MALQRFSLGQTVMTKGIADLLDSSEICMILSRHATGDWGDLCQEDKELNESALKTGDHRLFSAYKTTNGKVWVITEYDHSVTTILLPREY